MTLKKKLPKNKQEFVQLVQYSITGGAWFWSGYLMFALCDQVFGLSLFWAKLIANLFGLSVNFALERLWVFDDHKRRVKKLTIVTERYIFITIANLFIDYLTVRILRDSFGITPYIGQFISAGFFWGWNYLWYRYWVFATNTKKA